ncbi:MAG: plastocyanin/azurin family copper-binding protein [Nitrosotalea sp.]
MSKPTNVLFGLLTLVAILAIAPSAFAQESGTTVNISAGAGSSPNCSQANNCFDPDITNVVPGTTVTWQNNDKVSHTVTSGSPSDNQTGTIFDSSLIASGKDYSFTFNNPGTYSYFCQVHPWMTGQVIVGAASTTSNTTSNNTPTTSTAPSMNMSSGTTMSSTPANTTGSNTTTSTAPSMNMSSGTTMSSTPSISNQSNSTTPTTNTQPAPTTTNTQSAPAQPSETSSALAPTSSTQSTGSTDPSQMFGWATGMTVAAILSGVGIWTAVRRR